MSIIQEALKRAQYNYTDKKSLPPVSEKSEQEPVVPSPAEAIDLRVITKKMGIIVYVIVLLALVTGFGIRALFLKMAALGKGKESENLIAAAQKAIPDNPVSPSLPSTVVARATEKLFAKAIQPSSPSSLVLNGIMYIEKNPKAIINGMVVTEGDVIGGATVTSITQNNVMLKYNNNDNKVEMALKLKE